jgi:hypothetical protein
MGSCFFVIFEMGASLAVVMAVGKESILGKVEGCCPPFIYAYCVALLGGTLGSDVRTFAEHSVPRSHALRLVQRIVI